MGPISEWITIADKPATLAWQEACYICVDIQMRSFPYCIDCTSNVVSLDFCPVPEQRCFLKLSQFCLPPLHEEGRNPRSWAVNDRWPLPPLRVPDSNFRFKNFCPDCLEKMEEFLHFSSLALRLNLRAVSKTAWKGEAKNGNALSPRGLSYTIWPWPSRSRRRTSGGRNMKLAAYHRLDTAL